MSQEDGRRDELEGTPDHEGSPESANPPGSGGWAAPGQGSPAAPPQDVHSPSDQGADAYGARTPSFAPPEESQQQDPQQSPGYGPPPGQGHGSPGQGTAPGYGPPPGQGYGPPGYGPPGPGQTGYGQPQPPKPGVVALRPMTLGDIFNGAFSYIRNNPKTTFGLAMIVMAVATIMSSVASVFFLNDYTTFLDEVMADPMAADPTAPIFPVSPVVLGFTYLGELLIYVGGAVLLGLLAAVVGMAVLGYKLTPGQAWAAVRGRVGAILGLAFIKLGIQLVMVVALVVVLFVGLFAGFMVGFEVGGGAGLAVGFLVLLVGVLAIGAPSLWIWIRLYYAMPLIVLERLGPGQAMARSWRISQQSWWRTLGYWLLAGILVAVVSMVLTTPLALVGGLLTFVAPDALWAPITAGVITYVGNVVVYAIAQPFAAGVNTLLYIDLRMRREGLDLKLHQASQRGETVGPEIYLPENRA